MKGEPRCTDRDQNRDDRFAYEVKQSERGMPCQHSNEVHGPDAQAESDAPNQIRASGRCAVAGVVHGFEGDKSRKESDQE